MAGSSKANNKVDARERVRQMREAEKRKEKRGKVLKIGVISILAAFLIGALAMILINGPKISEANNGPVVELNKDGNETPSSVDANGAVLVPASGQTDKRIDLFFDPMCPGCGIYDRALNERFGEIVDSGQANLYLTPLAFLDEVSSDNYSTRAVSAFLTVADHDPRKALDFLGRINDEKFQPKEGAGYVSVPDEAFVKEAVAVGVPEDVANEIPKQKYVNWVIKNTNDQKTRRSIFPEGLSTPSLFFGLDYSGGEAKGERTVLQSADLLGEFNKAFDEYLKK